MNITCGTFLFRDDKILVCHATGADLNKWTIPKGMNERPETFYQTAIRELEEETNVKVTSISLLHDSDVLGCAKYKKREKTIYVIVAKLVTSEVILKCNSFFKSKGNIDLPEIDAYKWVTTEEALNMIHPTQIILLKRYLKMIKK